MPCYITKIIFKRNKDIILIKQRQNKKMKGVKKETRREFALNK